MSCKTCINYGIYEMITGGKPYGYSGDIPCNRCSRYRTFEDLYIENTLFKSSVPSDEQIEKETLKVMLTNDEWTNLPDYYVKQIVVKVFHNLIMKGL